MAKRNKEHEYRMQGIMHARQVVKERGLEGLESDIRKRGFLRVPLTYTEGQINSFWDDLSKNLYTTMLTVTCMVLSDRYGFGKKRLRAFKMEFDKKTQDALDLDSLGEHYVTLEDYANYLNEEYGLGIDANRCGNCQESYDSGSKNYRMAKVDKIISILKDGGFNDAAEYLEERVK